jgi:TPR repeat protein
MFCGEILALCHGAQASEAISQVQVLNPVAPRFNFIKKLMDSCLVTDIVLRPDWKSVISKLQDMFKNFLETREYKTSFQEADKLLEEEPEVARFIVQSLYNYFGNYLHAPDCVCAVGHMYYKGHNVNVDKTEAVKWWTLAAKQGSVKAHSALALAYVNGESGLDQSNSRAEKLFLIAAKGGDAFAQFGLDCLYADKKNYKEAAKR